jgi:nicotinamide-nucleotide amidase
MTYGIQMTNNFYLSQQLAIVLTRHRLKLAVAESCTGGGLAYQLTSVPGSSEWFERGVVTYSNTSKMELLNVKPETLERYGAVSSEVAKEMSEFMIKQYNVDVSLSITGIAGPGGGSSQKPVGTVYFALADRYGFCQSHLEHFTSGRGQIREDSITFALRWLLEQANVLSIKIERS